MKSRPTPSPVISQPKSSDIEQAFADYEVVRTALESVDRQSEEFERKANNLRCEAQQACDILGLQQKALFRERRLLEARRTNIVELLRTSRPELFPSPRGLMSAGCDSQSYPTCASNAVNSGRSNL